MNLKTAFQDSDRAVSPVIGVILMVAITVILAAVIGTFVLGLGDSLGDSQPTAQLDASVDYANDDITIEHLGGDSIESGELTVIVSSGASQYESNGAYSSRLSVGEEVTADLNDSSTSANSIGADSELRIQVVHSTSESILLDRTIETTDSLDNIQDPFPLE